MEGRMRWKDLVLYYTKKAIGKLHPRIRLVHHFEVEPALYSDCPYYEELQDAEYHANYEDEFAEKYLDEHGIPLKWKKEMKQQNDQV
ncbi:hypothetical protein ES702_00581 [subsurface metagenome]